jgi:hypothetical protein
MTPNWTVILSTISSVASAVVALIATIIAARTYLQSRRDKQEEREANHPNFKLESAEIILIENIGDEYGITPFHELQISLKNVGVNPGKIQRIQGQIFRVDEYERKMEFQREPIDEYGLNEILDLEIQLPKLLESTDPYYLILTVVCTDQRTGKEYTQIPFRKFYIWDESNSIKALPLDNSELRVIREARYKYADELIREAKDGLEQVIGNKKKK